MADLTVYTFLSHDCRLLSAQLGAIRRSIAMNPRIVVVQGPFGSYPMTSAGPCRLSEEAARGFGITTIDVPANLAGLMMPERFMQIIDWVWRQYVISQSERHAILMHGDLFPIRPISMNQLHEGAPLAGRAIRSSSNWIVPMTWFSVDRRNVDFSAISFGTTFPVTEADRLMGNQFKPWESWFFDAEEPPHWMSQAARDCYQTDLRWEWCEPAWLHVDKLATVGGSTHWNEIFQRKLVVLRAALQGVGIDVDIGDDPCLRLDGLPNHAPRFIATANSTPEVEFDVEVERRRTISGGCCGPPMQAD